MINKWLHINEMGGDPWVLPIWNAVIEATKAGKIDPVPKEISELGLYISTRLNILPRIVSRLNTEGKELFLASEHHETKYESAVGKQGYVFTIDDNLKYNLLADIDSILFELNSVCELMSTLFEKLYSHAGKYIKKNRVGFEIRKVIENAGQKADWFQNLDAHRNFFIHEGSPYIAIDISKGSGKYDLIIMKQNLKSFNDPETFIVLSELDQIVRGFALAKPIIQKALISLFSENL
ncbi:MAG: hypothetical protein PHT49_07645 [Desulfovibrionales bacterium]|nr:hypothetical protein [Desulfovibrionales bacterium]